MQVYITLDRLDNTIVSMEAEHKPVEGELRKEIESLILYTSLLTYSDDVKKVNQSNGKTYKAKKQVVIGGASSVANKVGFPCNKELKSLEGKINYASYIPFFGLRGSQIVLNIKSGDEASETEAGPDIELIPTDNSSSEDVF